MLPIQRDIEMLRLADSKHIYMAILMISMKCHFCCTFFAFFALTADDLSTCLADGVAEMDAASQLAGSLDGNDGTTSQKFL